MKNPKIQGYDRLNVLGAFTMFSSRLETKNQQRAVKVFENEVNEGGFYAQMVLPRFFDYMIQTLNTRKTEVATKLEVAKTNGNAATAASLQEDLTLLELAIGSYQEFQAKLASSEEEAH